MQIKITHKNPRTVVIHHHDDMIHCRPTLLWFGFQFTYYINNKKDCRRLLLLFFFLSSLVLLFLDFNHKSNGAIITSIFGFVVVAAQHDLNGGSCLAMAGKDCVALVLDSRFGSGTSLVNVQARRVLVFPPQSATTTTGMDDDVDVGDNNNNDVNKKNQDLLFLVALQGLQGDALTLEQELILATQHQYARTSLGTNGRANIVLPTPNYDDNDNDVTNDDEELHDRPPTTTTTTTTISPRSLASYMSHLLYQRRQTPYYVEPMIVGLEKVVSVRRRQRRRRQQEPIDENNNNDDDDHVTKTTTVRYRPYLCSMDLLGSLHEQPRSKPTKPTVNDDDDDDDIVVVVDDKVATLDDNPTTFCCMGAAVESLYGTAQAFWKPNLNASELAQTCTKAFLAALERDSLSGYGARLYLLTATNGISVYDIVTRND